MHKLAEELLLSRRAEFEAAGTWEDLAAPEDKGSTGDGGAANLGGRFGGGRASIAAAARARMRQMGLGRGKD